MQMQFSPINYLSILLLLICLVCAGCHVSYDDSGKFKNETHGIVLKELPKIPEAEKPFDFPFSEGKDHLSEDNNHQHCQFDNMMF
jgi:hypothetical protein